jgi:diguanylate cyclase (GGDEF)-like protein
MSGMGLLLAIMTLQFGVHALGWGMTAAMLQRWRGPEVHFAAFWLTAALGLGAVLLDADPRSLARQFASALLVISVLIVHRGLLRFFRRAPPDVLYLALGLATLAVIAGCALLADGTRWRLVWVGLMIGGFAAGVAHLLWRHGRAAGASLAARLMALVLLAVTALMAGRIWMITSTDAPAAMSLDVERPANVFAGLLIFVCGGLFNLLQIQLALGRYFGRLLKQTRSDVLTGVANRRGFDEQLALEHRRSQRDGAPYAVLMIDIDFFKQVNDGYGHAAGDRVLAEVAARLKAAGRTIDTVGRIGGEEFALLLPGADAGGAVALAERIGESIRATPLLAERPELNVTVSIGIACLRAFDFDGATVLARADAALYRAKAGGRDRLEVEN